MGGKIPSTIRRQVITQWLYGFPRDQIAKGNQIGAGTVSEIIKQCKQKEYPDSGNYSEFSEFDLIREVAVMLKREGVDVKSFASSIRIQRKLDEKELSEEQIESLLEDIDVHCFCSGLKPEEFVNTINKISALSNNLGIPVDEIPEYMAQEHERLNKIRQEIINLQRAKMQALQDHNVTINTLQEYERNKPIADNLAATKKELEKVEKEMHSYKRGIERERFWKRKEEENRWLISVAELDKANKELGCSTDSSLVRKIEPGYLKNMVMDVYCHPSKYVDVIRQMMKTYNLEHK
jgi:DNA-binding transcriptional MerR regulator